MGKGNNDEYFENYFSLYVDRYCQLNDKISYIFIYYFI